jgi:phosphotransferase system IIB component
MGSLLSHLLSTVSWNARSSLLVCTTFGTCRSFLRQANLSTQTRARRCEEKSHGSSPVTRTAGHMTGGYLFKMCGLPAAALAITMAARPENRAKIGGIMFSAALTAFLTGITEPIDVLKTESGEYLKTAGPEADEIEAPSPVKAPAQAGIQPKLRDPLAAEKARSLIKALGGKANIQRVDACAETRLRIVTTNDALDEAALKVAGIEAIVRLPPRVVHLLTGLNADQYAAEMRGQLASRDLS